MSTGTLTYIVGAELGDAALWLAVNDVLVNLATGYTFELKGHDATTTYFTKTDGCTGAAGSGRPPDGTPNLVVVWDAAGELDQFPRPGTYKLQVKATTGGKDHIWVVPITIQSGAP